jgi:hypothetical protein
MMNFRLIGAAVLSLMLATPAMAMHHGYHSHYGPVAQEELPVQDALRLGYSTGCRTYHSGYGGLYGDGEYPGNVYDNCPHLDLAPTGTFN